MLQDPPTIPGTSIIPPVDRPIVCHGVISRSVRDTAAFYAAVEERYRNPALPEIGLIQHPGKERLRIGLFTDTPYNTPSHTDSVEVSVNAGKLCEDLGHNSPTLSHVPPKIGYLGPEVGFETHFERIRQYVAFTPLQNAAGAPAISLPLGFSRNGLPIGVQFAAAYGQEKRLLKYLNCLRYQKHIAKLAEFVLWVSQVIKMGRV